jgi:2-polyprenyl-6-methoxyphenol hydroxylase-like FAD-dependent oxidoreductase
VPVAPWVTRRITLLGDAIHSMTPYRGIGANVALKDAMRLCRALAAADRGERPLVDAIHSYEADMLDYGFRAAHIAACDESGDHREPRPVGAVAHCFASNRSRAGIQTGDVQPHA